MPWWWKFVLYVIDLAQNELQIPLPIYYSKSEIIILSHSSGPAHYLSHRVGQTISRGSGGGGPQENFEI